MKVQVLYNDRLRLVKCNWCSGDIVSPTFTVTALLDPYLKICSFELYLFSNYFTLFYLNCQCHWPRGLRRRSAAAPLLRLWVWIPPGTWMFVCCECCVLSGRSLCDELITRPEEFYRLWCVVVCDLETSWIRRSWPVLGCSATIKNSV
jgi:hypothetical protein